MSGVSPLVIKFGGTSVGDGEGFVRAARIVSGAAGERPVAVVVSAMSGVTDALLGATGTLTGARTTRGLSRALCRRLAGRHLRAARHAVGREFLPEVEARLRSLLGRLEERFVGGSLPQEELRAEIAVYGERLSAEILAGALRSAGVPAAVSPDPIATGFGPEEAEVLPRETAERCTRHVRPLLEEGLVAVVPGYAGRSPDGAVTTLGRGGSDLSATALGRGLGAGEVWIMTDVDGVLDADPRLVPDAATLPRLSYREAGVFAALGAEVLHPRTMEPAAAAGMEVLVRNTFDPEAPGTRISARECGTGLRALALCRELSVEPLEALDGHSGEVFCLLGVDVYGVRALVRRPSGSAAAIVGVGSPGDGDLVRGLRRLGRVGIRPLWAGSTAVGLTFVVAESRAEEALRELHAALLRRREALAGEAVA
ncbi:hypothetical protein Rxycam_00127 [Rubrobacter xylanophilus DSM 9941]|uniref:aspartate kinase n=1 Tax=Rubrobacter xylanophilus TaxID=49319 RepID=UPI001C63E0B8|nr:aspartate kinase [Rubrobacter xylanophilus]QYJ14331.1 hypothetical protein Rxycam_00127 [Rubrobacter xylanophilus DSM 9941]